MRVKRFCQPGSRIAAVLMWSLAPAIAAEETRVLHVSPAELAEGRLELEGAWRYHGGDEPAWADPTFDDGAWPLTATGFEPRRMPPGGWPGIGWFRLHLEIDAALVDEPLALVVRQEGASEIFLDGRRLARIGRVASRPVDEELVDRLEVIRVTFSSPAKHVLAVRHSDFLVARLQRLDQNPGFTVDLVTPDEVEWVRIRPRGPLVEQVLFTGVSLFFGVLHLLFFVFERRARENLFFALAAMAFAAAVFLDHQKGIPDSLALQARLALLHRLAVTALVLACLRFVYALRGRRLPARFWGFVLVFGAIWAHKLLAPIFWRNLNAVLTIGLIVAVLVELGHATLRFVAQRRDGAWIVGAGMLALFGGGLLDALMDFGIVDEPILWTRNPYLYGGLALLFAMSIHLARGFADHARKTAELEEARQLQLALLPRELPVDGPWDVAATMRTATEVGGDYYDFHVDGDALTVAIGDAVGHGARAGTLVAATKSLFQALAGQGPPVEILGRFNAALRGMGLRRMHMALTLARLEAGRARIAAAGMPPVLIHRGETGDVEEVDVPGLPLGSSGRSRYRQEEVEIFPGDTVLLLSDGFPELRAAGEEIGYARARSLFREACGGSARDVVKHLEDAVDAWTRGQPPDDDVTFVVVRILPAQ